MNRIFKAVLIFVGLVGVVVLVAYAPVQITIAIVGVVVLAWGAWTISEYI